MVLDTSALIAILAQEPEASRLAAAIDKDAVRLLSAASLVEAGLVAMGRFGDVGARQLDALLRRAAVEVVALSAEQARIALDVWRRFGRGNHPAALNLGDCYSYALSRDRGEPLLCKGDDFPRTDVSLVPY